MENEKKNNTKNKSLTIRIQETTYEQYNQKLQELYYKENHRKQSSTIDEILKQFNKQDTNQLRKYINKGMPIINLNNESIQQYQDIIAEKDDEIQTLKQAIQKQKVTLTDTHHQETMEKEKIIQSLESSNKQLEQSITEKYDNEIHSLENAIKEKEKIIQDNLMQYNQSKESLEKVIAEKNATIQDKDKTIEKQQRTIDTLDEQLKQSNKDVRTARNDYKHQTENINKLQKDYNSIEQENKEYAVTFAEIKKMSIIERIASRYPKKFYELTDGNK